MKEKTKKEIGFTENYTNKREQYLNLRINNECVWVTKLRSILNSDIHEKPLGCKISNTHIRIGKVHLDTFYEAQILFSHAHWVQRFANELSHKITDSILQKKRIVLVGYETYIEPVMYLLKEVIKKKYRELDVEYCIFEEEKYTYLQNVKAPEIRYIETAFKKGDTEDILKATQIVFICGISTTLSTYARMLDQVKTDLSNKIYNDEIADKDEKRLKALFNTNVESKDKNPTQNAIQYFSIIQVLPNNLESDKCKFVINDKDDFKEILTWDDSKKWVNRRTIVKTVEKTIDVPYIVDVKCGWYNASDCKMCYPDDILKEKPIIQTSETSVVPIQRILLNKRNKHNDASDTIKVNSIDFFEKDKEGNFIFRDYLYYGHTVRGEHHFLYYIRTNHLFADIISDNIPKCVGPFGEENFNALKKFKDYCNQAKKNIEERLNKNKCSVDDAIHIIISPSHFSSKMFCNAINQYVFKYKAHVISFDPQKEYRSSFETKYSNYAYFLEQTKEIFEDRRVSKKKLFFYFVDDQIITGSNFYRMTSLIKNLFVQTENIKIWNGVFVIVNRNSNSTKMDYVDEVSAYYPLFNISVPSVRSYADSCPMCKMRADAENYVKKSVLDCNAHHWMEKVSWHKLNTLEQAKEKIMPKKGESEKVKLKKKILKDRRFRRFYCENELQKVLSGQGNGENIHNILVEKIGDILVKNKGDRKGEQCEYLRQILFHKLFCA